MNLTERQQEIVDFKEGALLVTACPGSGKTRVLTERVKRLLLATRRGKILAVTFSNKAADEMNTRLSNDQEITELLPRVTMGTLHSFAMELVLSRYHTIGLPSNLMVLEKEEDRIALLKKVIQDAPFLSNDFIAYSPSLLLFISDAYSLKYLPDIDIYLDVKHLYFLLCFEYKHTISISYNLHKHTL